MKLEDWRNEIDEIDTQIVRLINQRARIARKLGELKAYAGLPIVDSDREDAILRRVRQENEGVLEEEAVVRIFKRIIIESRQVQNGVVGMILEEETIY
jgi:chorismate mutase